MSHFEIPKSQVAAVVERAGDHPVKSQEQLAHGECLVKLECSGACHTDFHAAVSVQMGWLPMIMLGDWPVPAKLPLIGGHEGVGIIETTPHGLHCLNCEHCKKGREQNCSQALCSGFTVDGTFQEYVVSYVNHVTPIPDGLPSDAAASILCAGVTVYRAIKYMIPGAGGGLGHLAIQYAPVRGLCVIAIDTGEEKKELCLGLGAEKWIDFMESKDIVQEVKDTTGGQGAHSAVVTAATAGGYQQAIEYLRSGSTLMCNGLPGKAELSASIFWTVFKSISIIGSYVGNRQDAAEAVDIAAKGLVKVHFVTKPLSDLENVYVGMQTGKIAGRVVLDMSKE
ncbi:NAD(P)-binding protein [Gymnopus androsaceus JB14]|uniref:alcohol dehydrogenase n=1 Tax=Gymnopus androsaceus JB14 TaxID=1447944 RepID=A0A6A4HP83_9AGAR|nr:NAD(P)-binding protein [Gymnopus androsaceus JB14]